MRSLLLLLCLFVAFGSIRGRIILTVVVQPTTTTEATPISAVSSFLATFNAGTSILLDGMSVLSAYNYTNYTNYTEPTPSSSPSSTPTSAPSSTPPSTTPTPPSTNPPQHSSTSRNHPVHLVILWSILSIGFVLSHFDKKQMFGIMMILLITQATALQTYQNCILLDPISNYRLHWTVDSTNQQIQFAQTADIATGWLAIGFSSDGTMDGNGQPPGTDIIIGSSVGVFDYNTYVYNTPILDPTQNVNNITANQGSSSLEVEWVRSYDTKDPIDYVINVNSPATVIWSLNDFASPASSTSFTKHNRASLVPGVTITFSQSSQCPGQVGEQKIVIELNGRLAKFNSNTFLQDLASEMGISANRLSIVDTVEIQDVFCTECDVQEYTIPNYLVPTQETTYVSYGFAVPSGPASIIRIEPMLDNTLVLHHMVLYLVGPAPNSLGTPVQESMPSATSVRPLYAWAPGQDYFDLPPNVGFNTGTNINLDYYIVINFHYNNPTLLSTARDSSGFKLYFNTTRPISAAFSFFGYTNGISIPAGANLFRVGVSFPIPAALNIPLTVFASFPHMHKHGQKIWMDVVRNNATVTYLGKNLAWDYNSQYVYPENFNLQAKDILITQCLFYNDGTTAIIGGESTSTEMCLVGIAYYPDVGGSGFQNNPHLSSVNNCDFPCLVFP